MRPRALHVLGLLVVLFVTGCATTATNRPLPENAPAVPVRSTFDVDGRRGNPRVLTYLALSGGGSRSAYFASAVMLNLQTAFDDTDLLEEVDVISAVSGGALAAAYYAGTQDRFIYDRALAVDLIGLPADQRLAKKISVKHPAVGAIACEGRLTEDELEDLRRYVSVQKSLDRLTAFCASRTSLTLRFWDPETVRERMAKDYLVPWLGRWFLPQNFFPYWFSSLDRSDIMAQTFAGSLFSKPGMLGHELTMADLNPARPFLILNATSATQKETGDPIGDADPPFGSVFTFTAEDFSARLGSRIDDYSVARAVMGSSAFPVVFQNMTLADHRKNHSRHCPATPVSNEPCSEQRYLHIFDGGNSDNLGLHSVKRSILERAINGEFGRDYDAIVVILVDAITESRGADRYSPDPRGFFSLIADLNVTDAVDALLKGNHDKIIREFTDDGLSWQADCRPQLRNLPQRLCDRLRDVKGLRSDVRDRLIFMHIGFENVHRVPSVTPEEASSLEARANRISTSFNLKAGDDTTLGRHADLVVAASNPCLQQLRHVYRQERPEKSAVLAARQICKESVPKSEREQAANAAAAR